MPYDSDGEPISQLIKIPEHGCHLSTAIERVDHALLLVYQAQSCRGDYMLGSMGAGWGVAWETLDRPMVADDPLMVLQSSWGMALGAVLHPASYLLSIARHQVASSGQSYFPVPRIPPPQPLRGLPSLPYWKQATIGGACSKTQRMRRRRK